MFWFVKVVELTLVWIYTAHFFSINYSSRGSKSKISNVLRQAYETQSNDTLPIQELLHMSKITGNESFRYLLSYDRVNGSYNIQEKTLKDTFISKDVIRSKENKARNHTFNRASHNTFIGLKRLSNFSCVAEKRNHPAKIATRELKVKTTTETRFSDDNNRINNYILSGKEKIRTGVINNAGANISNYNSKFGHISYLYHSVPAELNAPFLAWLVGPRSRTCLASVISNRWIITNGKCISKNPKPGMYKVFAGFDGATAQERLIVEVHHNDWNQATNTSSISNNSTSVAVGKTDHDWVFKHVKAITLRKEMLKTRIDSDNSCKVWGFATKSFSREENQSGYVNVDTNNLPLENLQRFLPLTGVRTAKECSDLYGIKYDYEVCVAYPEGKTDLSNLCIGDSGAPLVCRDELVGIFVVKTDHMVCQRRRDMFADVGFVYPWINSHAKIPAVKTDVSSESSSTQLHFTHLLFELSFAMLLSGYL